MHRGLLVICAAMALSACVTATATPVPPAPTTSPTIPEETFHLLVGEIDQPQSWPAVPTAVPSWDPATDAPVVYPSREVSEQEYQPFATAGPLTLTHPSDRVEVIGFHESTHDGSQQMETLPTTAASFPMESRERGTGSQTAADIAVDPHRPIRSPITGTVLRSGTYILYCEYSDDFAVIEPDDRPGWEVKVLHINNVSVSKGERVEAGVTVIADGPTPLPFRSQVDDATSAPSWPHVHVEVIDPSIPDRPSGSGC